MRIKHGTTFIGYRIYANAIRHEFRHLTLELIPMVIRDFAVEYAQRGDDYYLEAMRLVRGETGSCFACDSNPMQERLEIKWQSSPHHETGAYQKFYGPRFSGLLDSDSVDLLRRLQAKLKRFDKDFHFHTRPSDVLGALHAMRSSRVRFFDSGVTHFVLDPVGDDQIEDYDYPEVEAVA